MTLLNTIVLAAFFFSIVAVYAGAAAVLIGTARRRVRGTKPSRAFRLARGAFLGLAACGALCFAWGFYEPYCPQVTRVRVPAAHMKPGARPFRLVAISDLHSRAQVCLEERLPGIIAAEKPDAIVFLGDALNRANGLPLFKRCMTRLADIAPTFAVYGNWDVNYWPDLDLYGGTGVRLLEHDAVRVREDGPIWIAGATLFGDWRIDQALRNAPPDAVKIVLYHTPEGITAAMNNGADILCAGHTHGGQIRLPFYGGLISLKPVLRKYESGLFREGDTCLYVNRGIGTEGGWPHMRFLARPEITVIDIVP